LQHALGHNVAHPALGKVQVFGYLCLRGHKTGTGTPLKSSGARTTTCGRITPSCSRALKGPGKFSTIIAAVARDPAGAR
jgi:hypothetical protein